MNRTTWLAVGALSAFVASEASAKSRSKGELAVEGRAFSDDQDPASKDFGIGLFGRLELNNKHHKRFKERLRFFGRLDAKDQRRNVFVVEEGWAEWKKKPFRLRLGFDIVNWTATEAFHPADILNSRNIDSDLESLEKIGEPMAQIAFRLGRGDITAYFMPAIMKPIFPSPASRLSFAPPGAELGEQIRVDRDGEVIDGDFALQGALRITQTIGNADLSLHAVHHVDRSQPTVVVDLETFQPSLLFRTVTQLGGTYQHVFDSLITKVEGAYRLFSANGETSQYGVLPELDHAQVAVGFEWGFENDSGVDSTFLLEGQALFGQDEDVLRNLSIFQRDLLIGWRITLNDVKDTTLLMSVIFDIETGDEALVNFSYTQRLTELWSLEAAVRAYLAERSTTPAAGFSLAPLSRADHVRVALVRYF